MHTPQVSVIISTYNRQRFILACLQCLSAQTLPYTAYEVLIIDNNCTDNTAQLVNDFIAENPQLPFRYLFEAQKGVSFGRDRGIHEAKGDILVYLDDDAEAQPDLLEKYLTFFTTHTEAAAAGGRILPKFSEEPEPEWMSKYLNGYIAKVDLGGVARIFEGRMKYPIGCNMAYLKRYLVQIGGFNTKLTFRGDDKYIYLAVKELNPNIFYVPEALVYHNIPGKRLHFSYLKTLYLKTGNEEKVRVRMRTGASAVFMKMLEFIFKFGVSVAIWIVFAFTGRELKGRYVMYSQWFTLRGFFMKNVFVR